MALINLPLEVLHQIASDLSPKDTCNLISTSRRMHSVFQRKLYTNVVLQVVNPNAPQIFFYTVARNPDLAGYVQSLALASWETYQDWETDRDPEKTTERPDFDSGLIRNLVDKTIDYSEEEKKKWLHDLEEFYDDAWLALLIPRLTNLRKLGLEWPFGSSHVSMMLNKAAINGGVCLPHLEEVDMCWYDTESGVASYQMNPFFKFPSVRKVSGWKVAESAKEDDEEEQEQEEGGEFELDPNEILSSFSLPPRCSNVTDIDLSQTNAGEGMREWIQACKTLKSFRIIHGGAVISDDYVQPRKLYNSLSLHKSTLEALWFEHCDYPKGENDDEWMGSFVGFSALKFIRLSLSNLVGLNGEGSYARKISDVIPSSLETLFLDVGSKALFDVVDDLAEIATPRKFSKLTTLHVETYKIHSTENAAKVAWLQQRCREVGVACYVHDRDHRDYMEGIRLRNSLWSECEAENLDYSN
ncbi:hypothetical protein BDV40DRAFT_2289 [Aspergillus tamarii]|uniref:F-box domain-containing protein n=1 Tax=Aspergillus tamarii TaxID=41984 RepID=A0A5N6VCP2_ASPTM|nr:hypothetical protein BDV40DRAFT_2289 [Aspergillus tamarii]